MENTNHYAPGEIVSHFAIQGDYVSAAPYGSGHINDTFAVTMEQGGREVRYLLQRVNHVVFQDVPALMENIQRVTSWVDKKLSESSCPDASRRSLTLIPSHDDQSYHRDEEGNFWRVYLFIEKAKGHDIIENTKQAYEASKAFAEFQSHLADLPGGDLNVTIPNFHHTPTRLEALKEAMKSDAHGRLGTCREELDFILGREEELCRIAGFLESGEIPLRSTHNDCKLNNVLLDEDDDRALAVIDLDTLMPGSSLFDFGDLVRTSTSPVAEDEKDASKVTMNMDMYKALEEGFLSKGEDYLTDHEKELMPLGGVTITGTVGIRFLTDYLNGDTYFKTKYAEHNLVRCRTQLALVKSIESSLLS